MHESAPESRVITFDVEPAWASREQAVHSVPPSWERIELVRQAARDLFPDLAHELRETIAMAGSELAENVVKYGEPMPDADARVSIARSGEGVTISASSGLASTARARELAEHLDRIVGAPDASALYLQRMQQLIEEPGRLGTQLGLLRIVCEGGFQLSMTHVGSRLTVVATRKLP
jgi:hypothetical protein